MNSIKKHNMLWEVGRIIVILCCSYFISVLVSLALDKIFILLPVEKYFGLTFVKIFNEIITDILFIVFFLKLIKMHDNTSESFKFNIRFDVTMLACVIILIFGFRETYYNTLGIFMDNINMPVFIQAIFNEQIKYPILAFISFVIIAPVFEEIVYHGIILDRLLNRYNSIYAIIFSSGIFSLVHLNIPQSTNAFLIGIIIGILYYKTRSIGLCIFAHMLNNMLVVSRTLNCFKYIFHRNLLYGFLGIVIFTIGAFILYHKSAYCWKKTCSEELITK